MQITLKNQGYTVSLETVGGELKSYKNETGKEYVWNLILISGPVLHPFYSLPSGI